MTYHVVVGVDGSAHGAAALRFALAEAEAHAGRVTAVFAWQVPFLSIPAAFDREELEKAGIAFLIEKVSAVAPSPTVPLRTVVAEGDPAESLITAAKDADLLVVGTHGRSTFRGLLVGAVSLRCIAGAACPVVAVKLPGEAAQVTPEGTGQG